MYKFSTALDSPAPVLFHLVVEGARIEVALKSTNPS